MQIEYTGVITMNPDDSPFKKMEKMPQATGKLLEFYIKEMEKARVNERELDNKVRERQRKIDGLEKEKTKLVEAMAEMQDGQAVLDRLKQLDNER